MRLNKFGLIFATTLLCSAAATTVMTQDVATAAAEVAVKDASDLAGATAVLAECDKRHNYFKDQHIHTDMILNGGAHHDVKYTFDTYTKGSKRSVRFDAPAEMRGMGVVTKGRDEVYARLPDSSKVRRVGTHAKRQSFYGSDWSMDDMSMIYYGQDYDVVKVVNVDDNNHYVFELKLKDGVDLPYPKLIIKIDKATLYMDYIEYYDDTLALKKIQERFDLKDVGSGHKIYTHIKVTDPSSKHTTENFVTSEEIDKNVPDETFTKRWLVRSL